MDITLTWQVSFLGLKRSKVSRSKLKTDSKFGLLLHASNFLRDQFFVLRTWPFFHIYVSGRLSLSQNCLYTWNPLSLIRSNFFNACVCFYYQFLHILLLNHIHYLVLCVTYSIFCVTSRHLLHINLLFTLIMLIIDQFKK